MKIDWYRTKGTLKPHYIAIATGRTDVRTPSVWTSASAMTQLVREWKLQEFGRCEKKRMEKEKEKEKGKGEGGVVTRRMTMVIGSQEWRVGRKEMRGWDYEAAKKNQWIASGWIDDDRSSIFFLRSLAPSIMSLWLVDGFDDRRKQKSQVVQCRRKKKNHGGKMWQNVAESKI